jgi:hypothetical protein
MKKIILLVVLLASCLKSVSAYAAEIFAVGWPNQAYSIESTTGQATNIGTVAGTGVNALARHPSGVIYTMATTNLLTVNPATGAGTVVTGMHLEGPDPINSPAMAISPGGLLYLINRDDNIFPSDWLYRVNISTGEGILMGPTGLTPGIQGLAFATNGTLYGWHVTNGLVTIGVGTGNATDVNGAVGATSEIQCLGFSPQGTLYGARSALYAIDLSTGVLTLVGGNLPDIRGLEFVPPMSPTLTIFGGSNSVRVCAMTQANKTYQFQYRTSITNIWENLGVAFVGTGAELCLTNDAGAGRSFYRVAVGE